MECRAQISLMLSSGMHSKAYSALLRRLCDPMASQHPLFLNAHPISLLGIETIRLSIPFHVSPESLLQPTDQLELLPEAN
jgi:hypothetical protein